MSNRRRLRPPPIVEPLQRHAAARPDRLTRAVVPGSPWLRAQHARLPLALLGTIPTCAHLTNTAGDGIYALWKPDKIRCGDCSTEALLDPADPEEHTCDRCRRRIEKIVPVLMPPSESAEALAGVLPQTVLALGLCHNCMALEGGRGLS